MEEVEISDVKKKVERYLISVDAAWRHLRSGNVDQAHLAAIDAERRHDELVKMIGPGGVSFNYVGNLIVGIREV